MSEGNNKEEPEILTEWEKSVSKKLEKLDAMEQEIADIKKLVTTKLEPAKVKPLKPAKATVKELIAKSTPFLGEFNPQKFAELAIAEGLVGNDKFSDQDIALINCAVGEPLFLFEDIEKEDTINLFHEKLGIEPARFKAVAEKQEEDYLPVDDEWYEETPEKPSEIEVIKKTVSEETPAEEEN